MRTKLKNVFSDKAYRIFKDAIDTFKIKNTVTQPFVNKYSRKEDLIAHLLYRKCWIDAVQWTYEDIIRDPNINPENALVLKRKIDVSNQERTDIVENIDSYFLEKYKNVQVKLHAKINSESPAWAIDRLSILTLKIYHMKLEANRKDASEEHRNSCSEKLNILLQQREDLSVAIDDLLYDIANGNKYMKVYKQMKMYNDSKLNPILYKNK